MPPLLLLACADEASLRSLESVLTAGGNRVITAETVGALLDEAINRRPDAIILDAALAEPPRFALCRRLRSHPAVSPATPIILTKPGPALRGEQLEALRAGAWELVGEPLDAELFLLRLASYMQGKLAADRAGAESLVDQASDLYNAAGMTRRSEELAALTVRRQMPLTCAVFRPAPAAATEGDENRLAVAFKQVGRASDLVARTRPAEFAVFAPATDESGAQQLVRRLQRAVARALNGSSVQLRAGVSIGEATERYRPADLLARARRALETT